MKQITTREAIRFADETLDKLHQDLPVIIANILESVEDPYANRRIGNSVFNGRGTLPSSRRDAAEQIVLSILDLVMDACRKRIRLTELQTEYRFGDDWLDELVTVDETRLGWIYFVRRRIDGAIKIGFSEDVDRRIKEIETGAGECELIAEMVGRQSREAELHRQFAHRRLHGEWFSPNDELIDLMRKWPVL